MSALRSAPRAVIRCSTSYQTCSPAYQRQQRIFQPLINKHLAVFLTFSRSYSSPPSNSRLSSPDKINPPISTLPPPLNLPSNDPDSSTLIYYFQLGRAYGKFYWAGVKATWHNHQETKSLRDRLRTGEAASLPLRYSILPPALQDQCDVKVKERDLTRAEFQMLMRSSHDVGKLPLFGLLVCVFGEWLPLLVPFMPSVVPRTCRIPKQTEGMRRALEERRRKSFRTGIQVPRSRFEIGEKELRSNNEAPLPARRHAEALVEAMDKDQMLHVSSSLGLHRRIWERVGLAPPETLLRGAIGTRLQYLSMDDDLLIRAGGLDVLSSEEVAIACEERGIDVVGRPIEDMRRDLASWLSNKREDHGTGRALMNMLFKRPNMWILSE